MKGIEWLFSDAAEVDADAGSKSPSTIISSSVSSYPLFESEMDDERDRYAGRSISPQLLKLDCTGLRGVGVVQGSLAP